MVLLVTACTPSEAAMTTNNNIKTNSKEVKTINKEDVITLDSEILKEKTEQTLSIDIKEEAQLDPEISFVILFEDILGYDSKKLSDKEFNDIVELFKISQEKSEKDIIESLKIKSKAYNLLRIKGYDIPIITLVDAAETLKSKISSKQYNELINLADKNYEEMEDEEYDIFIEKSDSIISKFGLSTEEILGKSEDEIQLSLYNIKNGQLIKNNSDTRIDINKNSKIDAKHKYIWDNVKRILPTKYTNMITKFEISTDGPDNSTAYVKSLDNINFTMSVDIKDIFDKNGKITEDAIWTFVHESAHIISMNNSQMASIDENASSYTVNEGTFRKGSYMEAYYNEFWKDIMKETNENEDLSEEFYKIHKNDFITAYASTNPIEDFAESFAEFVINDKRTGVSILDKKIQFFYRYPEFIKIRNDIKKEIK